VASNSRRHRRTISLPQRGAPFNVGKEESDGAGRQLRHHLTRFGSRMKMSGIVAWGRHERWSVHRCRLSPPRASELKHNPTSALALPLPTGYAHPPIGNSALT
jgi:hypothetical protein